MRKSTKAKPKKLNAKAKVDRAVMDLGKRQRFRHGVAPVPPVNREVSAPVKALNPPPLARGKVRRFEMGASGQGWDRYLIGLGYDVRSVASRPGFYYVVDPDGRKVKSPTTRKLHLSQRQLIAVLDGERVARGLQPICKAHGGR